MKREKKRLQGNMADTVASVGRQTVNKRQIPPVSISSSHIVQSRGREVRGGREKGMAPTGGYSLGRNNGG
jgi:hypothetical protein